MYDQGAYDIQKAREIVQNAIKDSKLNHIETN
jgi:hypothetical protein